MKQSFHQFVFLGLYLGLGIAEASAPDREPTLPTHPMVPVVQSVLPTFESQVESLMAAHGLPGAAIGIATPDSILYLKGFGLRAMDDTLAIDTETVFRIASLSKGFAATLAALLVREGRFGWDDPVSSLLPDFKPADLRQRERLTVADVLSHQTGWVGHAFDNLVDAGKATSALYAALAALKPLDAPGTVYAYQNVAFSLVGDVMERVEDVPFATLVRTRLLEPLGMGQASVGWLPYQASPNRAKPHRIRRGQWQVRRDKPNYYRVAPAAGVNASIHDMTLWLQAQMGGRPEVLPNSLLKEIHAKRVSTPGERRRYRWNDGRMAYGLGWRLLRFRGHDMIFHSGGLEGFFSQIGWIPELGVGIVVLHNSRRVDAMLPGFFDLLLEAKDDPSRLAAQDSPVELEALFPSDTLDD